MDLSKMTATERAELKRKMRELEQEEKAERDRYKELSDETVKELFPFLQEISNSLTLAKKKVFGSFDTLLEMKAELFGIKTDQQTHTFTTADGKISIRIGHRVVDNYDDTLEEGVAKVKEYMQSLAKDSESSALVDTVMKLLSKDKKGNLKASRVIELEQIALRTQNDTLREGIKIIKQASRPTTPGDFTKFSLDRDSVA